MQEEAIYIKFMDQTIAQLSESLHNWSKYSVEPRILETFVLSCKSYLHQCLSMLMPIFIHMSKVDVDYEIRERYLYNLFSLFSFLTVIYRNGVSELFTVNTRNYTVDFLEHIILPNLVWRAGQKASCIRGLSARLLDTFIRFQLFDLNKLSETFDQKILPLILSNMDDDLLTTRQTILSIFTRLLNITFLWNG